MATCAANAAWYSCSMTAAPRLHYTHREYVTFECSVGVKHEFFRGVIIAMAGGKPEHGARAVRVTSALLAQIGSRPCVVFDSDVRVRVRAGDLTAYPDASVVCGKLERDAEDPDAIVNPVVLVEILSPSTEEYDRGEKLDAYKLLPSLREVVLVAHDEQRIDVHRREEDGWRVHSVQAGESITLASIDCVLSVTDVYRDVLASQ